MRKIVNFISVPLLLLVWYSGHSQEIMVNGTVLSVADNMPLPGVSIVVKGTQKGVVSDFDGKFSIDEDRDAVLIFSYLGFSTLEVAVNNRKDLSIVL